MNAAAGGMKPERPWVHRWNRWRLHSWGLILGTVGFTLGLTPSLLPQTFLYQGLVSGMAAAAGYGVGVLAHQIWLLWLQELLMPRLRPLLGWITPRWRAAGEMLLTLVALLWLAGTVIFSLRWQRGIAASRS